MGLDPAELLSLRNAACLHDVGIVGIPGNLLAKKRPLNDSEVDLVAESTLPRSKMLEGVPGMEATRRAILEHHERFDGSAIRTGGLRGDDISLPARILSVAEFFDSMVSDRPHREGKPSEEALLMSGTVRTPCSIPSGAAFHGNDLIVPPEFLAKVSKWVAGYGRPFFCPGS